MCERCLTRFILPLLSVGSGTDPNALASFWNPIPHSGLPHPAFNAKGILFSYFNFICHSLLIPMGSWSLSEKKESRVGVNERDREDVG